jgi:hypothetical protein
VRDLDAHVHALLLLALHAYCKCANLEQNG